MKLIRAQSADALAYSRLCDKLYLKAETQQVDRILEQFSRRFWTNNPSSVFGSAGEYYRLTVTARRSFLVGLDVVHAVSYSLLLLNTDLHVVETSTRMLRGQFVKNTLSAIRSQTAPDSNGSALLFGPNSNVDTNNVFGVSDAMASIKSLDRLRENSNSRFGSSSSRLDMSKNGSPIRTGDSPRSERAPPHRSVSAGTVGSMASTFGSNAELEPVLKVRSSSLVASTRRLTIVVYRKCTTPSKLSPSSSRSILRVHPTVDRPSPSRPLDRRTIPGTASIDPLVVGAPDRPTARLSSDRAFVDSVLSSVLRVWSCLDRRVRRRVLLRRSVMYARLCSRLFANPNNCFAG